MSFDAEGAGSASLNLPYSLCGMVKSGLSVTEWCPCDKSTNALLNGRVLLMEWELQRERCKHLIPATTT